MDLRKIGFWLISILTKERCFKYYEELKRRSMVEGLSREELLQLQLDKFKRLLNFSVQNIPFYRQRFTGFDPLSIKTVDDIKHLPSLTKEEIKSAGPEAIIQNQRRLINRRTSGTTGPPFEFVIDRDFFSIEFARNLRIFDLPGIELGEPWVLLTPLRGKKHPLFSWLCNRLVLDANRLIKEHTPPCCPQVSKNHLHTDESVIHEFLVKIRKHQPKAIYSYPSALTILATYVRKWNIRGVTIKIIISSGEVLTKEIRTFLEETFNGEVFNLYGTTEFPTIAEECKAHNGLHIFADSYIVESVDGEILVTDLNNYTMPFIRFKTGDRGIIDNNECRCGRILPRLEIIEGRISDLIILPDGRLLRRSFFATLFKKVPEITRFEIIQADRKISSGGKIRILLLVSKPLSETRKEFLIRRCQDHAGNSLEIIFQ